MNIIVKEENKREINENKIELERKIKTEKKVIKDENKNNKMNNNYIIAEIIINEKNINQDIRIINSFEEYKREKEVKDNKNDYKFENKKEIKGHELYVH